MNMKHLMTVAAIIMGVMCDAQSINDLDFLIGKWQVSEVVAEGTDREYT